MLTRTGVFELFAQDLDDDEKAVAYATQVRSMARRWEARSPKPHGEAGRPITSSAARIMRFREWSKSGWRSDERDRGTFEQQPRSELSQPEALANFILEAAG
jgi:hypothetical protein